MPGITLAYEGMCDDEREPRTDLITRETRSLPISVGFYLPSECKNCLKSSDGFSPVCGTDGRTYSSLIKLGCINRCMKTSKPFNWSINYILIKLNTWWKLWCKRCKSCPWRSVYGFSSTDSSDAFGSTFIHRYSSRLPLSYQKGWVQTILWNWWKYLFECFACKLHECLQG